MDKFERYVCLGDSITWKRDGFTITATLHHDPESNPRDYDCYDEETRRRYLAGEWWFGGVVLSVSVAGVTLDDHAASLWGLECNYLDNNDHLTDTALELEQDAIATGQAVIKRLLESSACLP